jgi:CheY-like chemotaxis protein
MKPHKVAIIDDDPAVLEAAATLLTRGGLRVATFHGRFDRLAFLLREQPDLLLLDVNMPAASGEELQALLLEQPSLAHIPVVYFSSNDEHDLRALVRRSGARGYLSKSRLGPDFAGQVARFLPPTSALALQ